MTSDKKNVIEEALNELAPLVDGEVATLNRFRDALAQDDELRDLRHEARRAADKVAVAAEDWVPPADLEDRILRAIDSGARVEVAPIATRADDTLRGNPIAIATPANVSPGPNLAPPAANTTQPRKPAQSKVPYIAASIAAAAGLVLVVSGIRGKEGPDVAIKSVSANAIESGMVRVSKIIAAGEGQFSVRRSEGGAFEVASAMASIPFGSSFKTDERTRAKLELSDGTSLVLNHGTELRIDGPRKMQLVRGELVADVFHDESHPAEIRSSSGRVLVLGTKLLVTATANDGINVRVTRGHVKLESSRGEGVDVLAGQEGVLAANARPTVGPAVALAQSVAWSALEQDREGLGARGIGQLRAHKPGEREERERPLRLANHKVTVRIAGNVARTEIEEVFHNDSGDVLEGVYKFPMPVDAQISRLALDVDGRLEEGAFVEKDRAQKIWRGVIRNATPVAERRKNEEFVWVPGPWRDPAMLEWQKGGQFELKIFPIPARGSRRVIIGYTQVIGPFGGGRRYVYPLAHGTGSGGAGDNNSLRMGNFEIDVDVNGAKSGSIRASNYSSEARTNGTKTQFAARDFVPAGDFIVDYKPEQQSSLVAWAAIASAPAGARPSGDSVYADPRPYVSFTLQPNLPTTNTFGPKDIAIIVDSSQSMVGDRFRRAMALTSQIVAELDRRDRFVVMACDLTCRPMTRSLENPSARASDDVTAWLRAIHPAGSSDLVRAVREARSLVRTTSERAAKVIYVGDGAPSTGYRTVSSIATELRRDSSGAPVTTIGIGTDSDSLILAAIARSTGGHSVPFVPGESLASVAMEAIAATHGASLENVRLELPAGVSDIAPTELPTLRAGDELVVTARYSGDITGDAVLRGKINGEQFEQRYPIHLRGTVDARNAFVPKLWAAKTIESLDAESTTNRDRIINLSKAFGVMSRHTSMLVLESEAMFRAFGVERATNRFDWNGEVGEAETSIASAEPSDVGSDDDHDADDPLHGLGEGASGSVAPSGRAGSGAGVGSRVTAGAGFAPARTQNADSEAPATTAELALERRELQAAAPTNSGPIGQMQPSSVLAAPMDPRFRRVSPNTNALPSRRPVPVAPPIGRNGQWMRRTWVKTASVSSSSNVSNGDRNAFAMATTALSSMPDSRDRHKQVVRAVMRIDDEAQAVALTEQWLARDAEDAQALVAHADALARTGDRANAMRVLSGLADLDPEDIASHERLALALGRVGESDLACAQRIAVSELKHEASPPCVSTPSFTQTENVRGTVRVQGNWNGGEDLDIALIAPNGVRYSWMSSAGSVSATNAGSPSIETLALKTASVGGYLIEVVRARGGTGSVSGSVNVTAFGSTRTIPFTLTDGRAFVGRVDVRREERLEAVPMPVASGDGWRNVQ